MTITITTRLANSANPNSREIDVCETRSTLRAMAAETAHDFGPRLRAACPENRIRVARQALTELLLDVFITFDFDDDAVEDKALRYAEETFGKIIGVERF